MVLTLTKRNGCCGPTNHGSDYWHESFNSFRATHNAPIKVHLASYGDHQNCIITLLDNRLRKIFSKHVIPSSWPYINCLSNVLQEIKSTSIKALIKNIRFVEERRVVQSQQNYGSVSWYNQLLYRISTYTILWLSLVSVFGFCIWIFIGK